MKKNIIRNALFLLFLTLTVSKANPFVEIAVEKDRFLKYEPVYLEINFNVNALPEGYFMSGLRDSRAMIGLVVVDPSGEKVGYQAPMKLFTMEMPDAIFFETLLISRNNFLFGKAGRYILFLVDKRNGLQISNSLSISIMEATSGDDHYIQQEIETHPIDYAMFVDLEGGDQFAYGKKIVEEMFKRKTAFHTVAAALLAINSSQLKYDYKNKKIERDKDISAVEKYFPDMSENSYVPKHLKLQASTIVIDQFNKKDVPDKLKNKIKDVAKRYDKEIKRSSRYKQLEPFLAN
jgi:hypothetical protein